MFGHCQTPTPASTTTACAAATGLISLAYERRGATSSPHSSYSYAYPSSAVSPDACRPCPGGREASPGYAGSSIGWENCSARDGSACGSNAACSCGGGTKCRG